MFRTFMLMKSLPMVRVMFMFMFVCGRLGLHPPALHVLWYATLS